jgi:hypothetical protein
MAQDALKVIERHTHSGKASITGTYTPQSSTCRCPEPGRPRSCWSVMV